MISHISVKVRYKAAQGSLSPLVGEKWIYAAYTLPSG
jgi:hypothetical protein